MRVIFTKAVDKAEKLLQKKPISYADLKELSKSQGVYLIYDKHENIVYVGKGKVLKRRLLSDHISGENQFTTSILRRKLGKMLNMKPGTAMKKWMIENYRFSWIEIDDKDETSLVEALLIMYLRNRRGDKLLND